jgi:DNA-binding NarL/FixJ family response regulator
MTQSHGTTPSSDGNTVVLTAQERDVLTASAQGLGAVGVARALGLSPEAVRAAIVAATEKLGARSKLDAIRIAYRDGHIDLPAR